MINFIILILAVVFFVILAALFAGAETGMYQLSRLRLRLGIEDGKFLSVILGRTIRDSTALLHSMLIGTNLAHYLATSFITYALLKSVRNEQAAELCATLIAAPFLLVFSELIPKNIFFHHADSLMPYCAPVLFAFHKIFTWCGAVPLLNNLSRLFARLTGSAYPAETVMSAVRRPYISVVLQDTHEEGLLSTVQTDIIKRLTTLSDVRVRSVMTPLDKVQMVEKNCSSSALLNKLRQWPFSRLPVYDRWPANIVGYINIYDCLASAQPDTDLHNFIKPIKKLDADTIVTSAIDIMQAESEKIVLVTQTRRYKQHTPVGIITMKDLVEELLGELSEW
jgi:putative hemolysin